MTYSIVARDPDTGEMGVAVQSHWFSVGSVCPWAQPGVGVVATQAMVEPAYGPLGLALLRAGKSPEAALAGAVAADRQPQIRQVAMLDGEGRVAAHTGQRCIAHAGHRVGDGWSVQANMMRVDTVPDAMAEAYETASGSLVDRILAALEAAEAAGGDVRGRQSAALVVVAAADTGRPWEDFRVELRVEDHEEPLGELRRLTDLHRAYVDMNEADERMAEGDLEGAMARYRAARESAGRTEMAFWQAVMLAESGDVDAARDALAEPFAEHDGWALLLDRLPDADLLRPDLRDRLLDR